MDTAKLHVTFSPGTTAHDLQFPRRYTLTHSDLTGELFLTIGAEYDRKQIGGIYTRLMRDEVLAELISENGQPILHVYTHVNGGIVFGTAQWRYDILHHHMSMVLEALSQGDQNLFASNLVLENTQIIVHFSANHKKYNKIEEWGKIQKWHKYALSE